MLSRAPGTQRSASHCCYCWHPALLSSALKLKISSAPTHPPTQRRICKKQAKHRSEAPVTLQLYSCSWAVHIPLPSAFPSTAGWLFFCLLFHSSLLKNLNKVFGQTNIGQMLLAYMMLLHMLPYSSSLVGQ